VRDAALAILCRRQPWHALCCVDWLEPRHTTSEERMPREQIDLHCRITHMSVVDEDGNFDEAPPPEASDALLLHMRRAMLLARRCGLSTLVSCRSRLRRLPIPARPDHCRNATRLPATGYIAPLTAHRTDT
jgi:hypothetical protein